MTETSIAADDMDAILDDALEELDDSDSDDNGEINNVVRGRLQRTDLGLANSDPGTSKTLPPEEKDRRCIPFGPPRPPPATPHTDIINNNSSPNRIPGEEDLQGMEESLRKMFRDLAVESQSPPETTTNSKPTKERTPAHPTGYSNTQSDQSTPLGDEKMLQDLFQGLMAAGGDDTSPGKMPNMDEIPDLDNLFAGLGGGDSSGEALGTDNFMEGMMEQLLSKELMYEPMKQVTEKFPSWLASKKDELSPEEWDQRHRQYDCFRRLVQSYEDDEEGQQTAKILEIMEEVQEYGQPPPEIINEIAPGLELDEDGLPKMNGGMMPPLFGGNSGGEDCRIM